MDNSEVWIIKDSDNREAATVSFHYKFYYVTRVHNPDFQNFVYTFHFQPNLFIKLAPFPSRYFSSCVRRRTRSPSCMCTTTWPWCRCGGLVPSMCPGEKVSYTLGHPKKLDDFLAKIFHPAGTNKIKNEGTKQKRGVVLNKMIPKLAFFFIFRLIFWGWRKFGFRFCSVGFVIQKMK